MLLKPQIKFPMFPVIYKWIESDYAKCITDEEIIEFTFSCQKEAESCKNEARKDAYQRTFDTLHQIITGKSYTSLSVSI